MLTKKLFFFLLVCFAMASCNKEDTLPADDSTISNSSIDHSTSTEVNFRTPPTSVVIQENPEGPPMGPFIEIPGTSSKLHRNANGITVNFKTKNLIPNNAYTLWWVIFGDDPGPPILVTHAAGHVVGGSGKGNFSSHLSVGEIFNNPLTAEVHLALRTHGPVQPEMMPDQIQTIDGGCLLPDIGFPSGPALYPDSDIVGYCANVQVAMHPGN